MIDSDDEDVKGNIEDHLEDTNMFENIQEMSVINPKKEKNQKSFFDDINLK